MAVQTTRRSRIDSAARWQTAAQRAIAGGVQVRQIASTGQWIATSGADDTAAYELLVTGNVAHGCDCLAGLNGDPVCRHRAAFYLMIGALSPDRDPEPEPAGITFAGSSDRQDIAIDGRYFGFAAYSSDTGWTLFQGAFPHARRRGTYCTLDELKRDLAALLPITLPVSPAMPTLDLATAAA